MSSSKHLSLASPKPDYYSQWVKEEKIKKLRLQEEKLQQLRLELARQEESLHRLNLKKQPRQQSAFGTDANLSVNFASSVDLESVGRGSQAANHQNQVISEPIIMNLTKPTLNLIDLNFLQQRQQADTSLASISHVHTKTHSHISHELTDDDYETQTVNISLPKLSCLNMTTGIQHSAGKKKRRTKKERSVKYPEGSTFNAKTLHLKPKKT